MNLYLIKRSPDCFVNDAYAYAVVAAETGEAAKYTHPSRGVVWKNMAWSKGGKDYGFATWTNPKNVRSRLIGTELREPRQVWSAPSSTDAAAQRGR
jgi:hypothetical protein